MLGLRTLLSQEAGTWQLSRMSDEDVIRHITELLASGRLHAHAMPVVERARSVSDDGESEQSAPFPLAARKAASEFSSPFSEPIESADFPALTEAASQAAVFCDAAETGKAFCERCQKR
jgi:hypothetical protein